MKNTTTRKRAEEEDRRICPVWMAYTFDNPLRILFHSPKKMFGPYLKDGMKTLTTKIANAINPG